MYKNNKKYRAILFDLDGTLVQNDMKKFIDAYFKTVVPRLLEYCPDKDHVQAIYTSMRPIFSSQASEVDLFQVFLREMSRLVEKPEQELLSIFMDYYDNEYKQIDIVKPQKGAFECVKIASQKAEKLVIATVPLFPVTAIKTRMERGNISDTDFDLITGIEIMHSSKPHLSYFQEIMDIIGCGPQECLMIGNDKVDDMSAKGLGIDTFLVTNQVMNKNKGKYKPDYKGKIKSLKKFLNELA